MAVSGHNSRVRTQYHFRPGKDGLGAWDVHKLIAMTADFPVKDVNPVLPLVAEPTTGEREP